MLWTKNFWIKIFWLIFFTYDFLDLYKDHSDLNITLSLIEVWHWRPKSCPSKVAFNWRLVTIRCCHIWKVDIYQWSFPLKSCLSPKKYWMDDNCHLDKSYIDKSCPWILYLLLILYACLEYSSGVVVVVVVVVLVLKCDSKINF